MKLSKLAEEIIELDRLNMEVHFIASNGEFDPSIRRAGLARELESGAKILEVRRAMEDLSPILSICPH